MLEFVKEAFQLDREYQQSVGLVCNVVIDGYTDFIFLNREGGTFHQGTMNKTIRRIIRDCNDEVLMKGEAEPVLLPHFSCHSLRHTFITRMVEAGVNVKVMQDTLGHADIFTTMSIKNSNTNTMNRQSRLILKIKSDHQMRWSDFCFVFRKKHLNFYNLVI